MNSVKRLRCKNVKNTRMHRLKANLNGFSQCSVNFDGQHANLQQIGDTLTACNDTLTYGGDTLTAGDDTLTAGDNTPLMVTL